MAPRPTAPPAPTLGSARFARVRSVLYVLVVLSYLLVRIGQLADLAPLLSLLSLAAVAASLPVSGWATRLLAIPFLAGGSWMLARHGSGWATWAGAFGDMAYLLALFVVLPFCSVPVRLGGYSQAIQTLLRRRVSGVFQLNCLVTSLAYVCGSFMSVAAVPIMMASMGPVAKAYPLRQPERFIAVSAVCGYALPILWTPVSGVVGVVVYTLHVDWLSLFPVLFSLSLACLVANWLIFHVLELRAPPRAAPAFELAPPDATPALPKLMQMLLAIVLLIAAIVLLEQALRIGLIAVATLAAIPFALAWSAAIGQAGAFLRDARSQLAVRLPQMADQYAIFLSAGFFAQAMRLTGVDHQVNLMFLGLQAAVGATPFLLLLPPLVLLLSFAGLHPLVVMALLGESLKPEVLGISAMQLATVLTGSAVLTYMAGPFSGTLGLVQSINRVSTFRLSLWNAPYALALVLLLGVTSLLL